MFINKYLCHVLLGKKRNSTNISACREKNVRTDLRFNELKEGTGSKKM